jgi:hypothetical protein
MNQLERRKLAKEVLKKQLKLGTKPNRGTTKERKANPRVPLTPKDILRIEKTISNLHVKISNNHEW